VYHIKEKEKKIVTMDEKVLRTLEDNRNAKQKIVKLIYDISEELNDNIAGNIDRYENWVAVKLDKIHTVMKELGTELCTEVNYNNDIMTWFRNTAMKSWYDTKLEEINREFGNKQEGVRK
jgi:hypothetical protein